MNGTNIQKTIEQLHSNILEQINHRTLLQYTGHPFIDEKYMFFLLLPFLNGETWDEQLHEGALTVGIIFVSLAEHEKIDEYNATSKVQQLTVLSGDYYSGRYYEILAYSGNIQLIRQMSKAILKRCEQQMKVYEQNVWVLEEWFETILSIETELIESFYKVYGFAQYIPIMKNTLLIRRLQEELQNLLQGNESIFVKKMEEANVKEVDVPLEMVLEKQINTLMNQLKTIVDSSNLKDELKQYIIDKVAYSHERF